MIGIFLIAAFAFGAKESIPVPTNAAECKNLRTDPEKPGHMPRGVTTENIKEYQQSETRCALSIRENPTYRKRCKETFEKLEKYAKTLNKTVTEWCDDYFNPKIHADGAPTIRCTTAVQNKLANQNGESPTQAGCSDKAVEMINNMQSKVQVFVQNLKEFTKTLQTIQKENYQVVEQSYNSGKKPEVLDPSGPGRSSALDIGNTANILVADALLTKIRNSQKDNERFRGVNPANYQKKFEPISDGWKDLHRLNKPSVFQEQARAYLNTEEVLLAAETYLAETNEALVASNGLENRFAETNYGSLGAAGVGLLQNIPGNGNGANDNGFEVAESLTGEDREGRLAGISTTLNGKMEKTADLKREIASLPKNSIEGIAPKVGSATTFSSTAASKSPGLSTRDSLKKRLESAKGVSKANGGIDSPSANEDTAKDETATLPADGSIPSAFGNLNEQGMMQTVGSGPSYGAASASNADFTMEGAKTDEAVKAMLQEMNSGLRDEVQGDYIGDSEGSSLFLRVKDFHERCLKKGCVLQLAHRKI